MTEAMTDFQFKAIISLVLEIVQGSATKEEVAEKLEKLLEEKK